MATRRIAKQNQPNQISLARNVRFRARGGERGGRAQGVDADRAPDDLIRPPLLRAGE